MVLYVCTDTGLKSLYFKKGVDMKKDNVMSGIVGLSCWGMILGIIILVLANKIEFDWKAIFFFVFLCLVGIGAAAQHSKG
jgi:hypothetical protein